MVALRSASRLNFTPTMHREITYADRRPTDAERDHLHHEAHEECFIANSVKTQIVVEEVVPA